MEKIEDIETIEDIDNIEEETKKIRLTDDPDYFKKYNIRMKKQISDQKKEYYKKNREEIIRKNKNRYNQRKELKKEMENENLI